MGLIASTARRVIATAAALAAPIATACIHNPPDVDGKPSAPRAANAFWEPPRRAVTPDSVPRSVVPSDIAERVQRLTLPDVVDIALLNNPQTRASYATARAAGAAIGAAYGRYLPQLSGTVTASRVGSTGGTSAITSGGTTNGSTTGGSAGGTGAGGTVVRGGGTNNFVQPSASASWLLFDFGRSSSFEVARQGAFAASYTHNSTLQAVVLAVEQAYFNYNSAKAVRDGDVQTEREDSANLAAAKARHDAGVATISDILQAQTTLSQASLTLETDQGNVQTTRGALAVALGFPANLPYDIAPEPPDVPIQGIAESVDTLVNVAVRSRPDLASYRAQAREAAANVGVIKGQGLPDLFLSGATSHTFAQKSSLEGSTYSALVGLSFPVFQGFTNSYDILQAREQAKASAANAEYQRDQVVYQVFSSYYNLRTATARVKSADDLLASAQASYDVSIGKYRQGVGSILDVLTAQAALASARSQQAAARWTWYSSLAQLSHDAGVLGLHGEPQLRLSADSSATPPPP